MPPSARSVVVLVDAENARNWLDARRLAALMTHAEALGDVRIRRAYANWASPYVSNLTRELGRLGFDFVHVYHPVAGKNSADIQMVVDAMDLLTAHPDAHTFVLATGDADFSPLFRRLRQRGRDVVGCGPKCALSETVTSLCTRFLVADELAPTPRRPAPVVVTPRVVVPPPPVATAPPALAETAASPDTYARLLKQLNWPLLPARLLLDVHAALVADGEPRTRADAAAVVAARLDRRYTDAEVKGAITVLFRAGTARTAEGEGRWVFHGDLDPDALVDLVDAQTLARVLGGCETRGLSYAPDVARALLRGPDDEARWSRVEAEARRLHTEHRDAQAAK